MSNLYNNGIMKKIGIYLFLRCCRSLSGAATGRRWSLSTSSPCGLRSRIPNCGHSTRRRCRAYKAGSHTLVVASFENGSTNPTSEKDCLRSLPDSLDAVSLTNADNFSAYDAEDLAVLKEKGHARALLRGLRGAERRVGGPCGAGRLPRQGRGPVRELGLDGFSFWDSPTYGDETAQAAQQAVAALFMEKFGAVAGRTNRWRSSSRATRSS